MNDHDDERFTSKAAAALNARATRRKRFLIWGLGAIAICAFLAWQGGFFNSADVLYLQELNDPEACYSDGCNTCCGLSCTSLACK